MASVGPFTGSKRKARLRALEDKRVRAFQRRLDMISDLAKQIRDEQHFQSILADIEDPTVRAETEKLLEPLLLFDRSRFVKPEPAPFAGLVLAES
jgi:hypothetical protein